MRPSGALADRPGKLRVTRPSGRRTHEVIQRLRFSSSSPLNQSRTHRGASLSWSSWLWLSSRRCPCLQSSSHSRSVTHTALSQPLTQTLTHSTTQSVSQSVSKHPTSHPISLAFGHSTSHALSLGGGGRTCPPFPPRGGGTSQTSHVEANSTERGRGGRARRVASRSLCGQHV